MMFPGYAVLRFLQHPAGKFPSADAKGEGKRNRQGGSRQNKYGVDQFLSDPQFAEDHKAAQAINSDLTAQRKAAVTALQQSLLRHGAAYVTGQQDQYRRQYGRQITDDGIPDLCQYVEVQYAKTLYQEENHQDHMDRAAGDL